MKKKLTIFIKLVSFFLCIVGIINCNSEKGSACFKKQGSLQTKEISVDSFSKINISEGIELVIRQSDQQSVLLTAGKNMINNIKFEVIENELKITNQNGCQLLRNYHSAKIYVTTPVLEKIYSISQYSIKSDGVLTFPKLHLETGIVKEGPASVFELQIDNEYLWINENISSVFKISGKTKKLDVFFWGGNGRLEGENFFADDIYVNNRSSNDMIVFPINSISGVVRGTGNIVLKNVPPIIEIEQIYTGHVTYP